MILDSTLLRSLSTTVLIGVLTDFSLKERVRQFLIGLSDTPKHNIWTENSDFIDHFIPIVLKLKDLVD